VKGGESMKAVATVLSNNLLIRARQENIKVTPMKLQKLLYYVCVKYVKETGEMPVSEPFEVWQYGPVIPSVYHEFKSFRAAGINKFARDAKGEASVVDEDSSPILTDCINFVWSRLKHFTGIELGQRTHQKGSGWYKAYQRDDEIITLEDMKGDTTI
jgi:uncharacterized phage-associated protein